MKYFSLTGTLEKKLKAHGFKVKGINELNVLFILEGGFGGGFGGSHQLPTFAQFFPPNKKKRYF